MVLKKEDFYDLGIFELMQNVWCYVDTITERGGKTPQFIYDYCCWNEEILREKRPEGGDLPPSNFNFTLGRLITGTTLWSFYVM